MDLNTLTAITPIDGRYRRKVEELAPYFSEFGLIKYRVLVEIEYLIAMVNTGVGPLSDFPKNKFEDLREVYKNFTERSEEHTSELQSRPHLVCRLLLEKKKKKKKK